MVFIRRVLPGGVLLAAAISMAQSSPRLPYAEATAVAIAEPVRAGTTVKAVLQVKVAPGFHIQSDKPRDPSLIPLTLTIDAPKGISVAGLTFPPAKDFLLKGSDQPLAVFEGAFPIEARLAVAKDHPAGDVTVPARLRYQACDDTTCFRPMTIPATWTFTVAAGGKAATPVPAARVSPSAAPPAAPAATAATPPPSTLTTPADASSAAVVPPASRQTRLSSSTSSTSSGPPAAT